MSSIFELEAFDPWLFNKENFPKFDHQNLYKYLCCFHTGRYDQFLKEFDGISNSEYSLFSEVFQKTKEISIKNFNNFHKINSSLFMSLFQYRLINKIIDSNENLNILEIGPGSGYLSILLAKANHKLTIIENFEPLMNLQDILFEGFDYSKIIQRVKVSNVVNFFEKNNKYDLIIANHALNEMHIFALRFYAKNLFANNKVLFQGLGDQKMRTNDHTIKTLEEYGIKFNNLYETKNSNFEAFIANSDIKINLSDINYNDLNSNEAKSKINLLTEGVLENQNEKFYSKIMS